MFLEGCPTHSAGNKGTERVRIRAVVVLTLAGLAFGILPSDPAPASCAPPLVDVAPERARPGDEVRITGEAWFTGCQDGGSCSVGCSSECEYGPPEKPVEDIQLFLRKGDTTHLLTEVSADSKFKFETRVTIPNVPGGRYRLTGKSASGETYARVVVLIEGPTDH